MQFYSPLRYPGGKGKLSDFMKSVYESNQLVDGWYIEPYTGGGSVALSLLFNMYVSKIILNDLDRSIYSFWYSVLNHTDELCQKILDVNINVDVWREQRKIQQNKENYNELELGFSTFFLNRTNRSGIIMGGIIGGVAQNGTYKIDARFNKKDLIKRIKKVARHKSKIELYNLDACDMINQIKNRIPNKSLVYLDPPYIKKGKDLYVNHYKHQDHKHVAGVVKNINYCNWIVSYDNQEEIKELYNKFRYIEYSINYSTTEAKKGKEIIFFDNSLTIPPAKNPMKFKLKNKEMNQLKLRFI